MSRLGRQPVNIPEGAKVVFKDRKVFVEGPKGKLELEIKQPIEVEIKDNKVFVSKKSDSRQGRAFHGLFRTLVNNMFIGVTQGWRKVLEIHGTGYRVAKEGDKLILKLGFSHPVIIEPVSGIDFQIEGTTKIEVAGIDKNLVGNVAAMIRHKRPPEPYKGKGIRYQGEVVRKKAGKAGKVGKGLEA